MDTPRAFGAGAAVVGLAALVGLVAWSPWSDDVSRIGDAAPTTVDRELPPSTIAVPEALTDRAPAEIVFVTVDGDLVGLSMPSGEVAVTPTEYRFSTTGALVLGEIATAFQDYSSGRATFITPDGEFVVYDSRGTLLAWPTRDGFLLVDWTGASNIPDAWFVDADGDRELLDDPPFVFDGLGLLSMTADGDVVERDASGADRYGADGSVERLTDDVVLDIEGSRMLTENCPTDFECTFAIVDLDTGESTPVDPEVVDGRGVDRFAKFTASLSPDGTAIARVDRLVDGYRHVIADLRTGDEVEHPIIDGQVAPGEWLADSSGVVTVTVTGQLGILDRASGDVIEIPLAVVDGPDLDLTDADVVSFAALRP